MRRAALLFFLLVLFSAWLPGLASAAITVSLSDGTTTRNPTTPAGFALTAASATPFNTTLNILGTCTAPCTRFFPSGGLTQGAGDTFKIQDVSATNRARVEKIDVPAGGTATTGADSFVVRGLKIAALTNTARTFTMVYSTAAGDFATIGSTSGNYAGTAKLKGQFRLDTTAPIDGNNGSIPANCSSVNTPCAQLSVKINLLTLNGTGSNLSTLVTASVPCSTVSGSASPCGSGGFWNPGIPAGDQFLASDTGTVGCGTTCRPFWQSTLSIKFNAVNQIFTLTTSAATAVAADTPGGLVDIAEALSEPGIDVWVGSCAGVQTGTQPYRVTGAPPFGNKGRDQKNSANFPMTFSLEVGTLESVTDGFPNFLSIQNSSAAVLPPGDRLRSEVCSMSWVPSTTSRPTFGALSQLDLKFSSFVIGTVDSGDSRLGPLPFSECTACFRVEVQLVDDTGVNQGTLTIYLGSDSTTSFKTLDQMTSSPLLLVSDGSLRVDASAMIPKPQACCISFASAQSNGLYGKLLVRAVTVLIDQGQSMPANHLVTDLETIVNGNSSNTAMQTVGNFQPSCDWPPDLKIYIYKVGPSGQRDWVFNVLNPTIKSCTLNASVNVTSLTGAGTYEAHVVGFSKAGLRDDGTPDPLGANTEFIGGVAFPNPGLMILK